jgi:hypothetical protein
MKADHPPLLAQGFKDIRLDELKPTFLSPFPSSITRINILRKFKHWVKKVKQLNVRCEIWVDGSFATEKIDPQDIDIVLFINSADIRKLSVAKKLELEILTNERFTEKQKKECFCDSYLVFAEDDFGRRYWEKQFGLSRKQTTKGIFRIII